MLLIFLHFTKILTPIERTIAKALNPVLSSLYSSGSYLRVAYDRQADKNDLFGAVERLNNEARRLTAENVRLKVLEEENQILREYLKFSKENKASFVLANIIAQRGMNADKLNQNIIIGKGAQDGVRDGAAVVVGSVIIGKVTGIKNNTSEICLITGEDCKLAATIQGIGKTSGIISGDMGLTIKMEFIPQTEEIKIGDTVITSGLEENIPRGLVMGRVSEVNKENNELWQSAVIEPLVDMDGLIIVSVLLL